MSDSTYNRAVGRQFLAALGMLDGCIRACPEEQWRSPIGKYPFWMVAYHTLCFADLYLSPGDAGWKPRTDTLHPAGWAELNEEYPSREFSQEELIGYAALCRGIAEKVLAGETEATLDGPSGFGRLKFSRAELHLYNMRHIQHHTGQLSAFLRRVGVDTKWVSSGWGPAPA